MEGLIRVSIGEDGSIEGVATAGTGGMGIPSEIRKMFPPAVQERYFKGQIHFQELVDHLRWRQMPGHREEPPLIVTGLTSTP